MKKSVRKISWLKKEGVLTPQYSQAIRREVFTVQDLLQPFKELKGLLNPCYEFFEYLVRDDLHKDPLFNLVITGWKEGDMIIQDTCSQTEWRLNDPSLGTVILHNLDASSRKYYWSWSIRSEEDLCTVDVQGQEEAFLQTTVKSFKPLLQDSAHTFIRALALSELSLSVLIKGCNSPSYQFTTNYNKSLSPVIASDFQIFN